MTEPPTWPAVHDDAARRSYELLALSNIDLDFIGLYRTSTGYVVAVAGLGEVNIGKLASQLRESWPAHLPVKLSQVAPERATQLPERKPNEVVRGVGFPRDLAHLQACLELLLSPSFPDFALVHRRSRHGQQIEFAASGSTRSLVVLLAGELSGEQRAQLRDAMESVLPGFSYLVEISPQEVYTTPHHETTRHELVTAKRLSRHKTPQAVLHAVEQDEEFWLSCRDSLLSPDFRAQLLPESWAASGRCRCLLSADLAHEYSNLRSCLTLFDEVVLTLPTAAHQEQAFTALGLDSEDELFELLALGRIRLLAGRSPHLYDNRLLERAVTEFPGALLLSRRLAAASIVETRRRMPLLFNPFGLEERLRLLRTLHELSSTLDEPNEREVARRVLQALSTIWAQALEFVEQRGASSTAMLGLATYANALLVMKMNRFIEFEHTSQVVEWAGALGAVALPTNVLGFYDENYMRLVAALYSNLRPDLREQEEGKRPVDTVARRGGCEDEGRRGRSAGV